MEEMEKLMNENMNLKIINRKLTLCLRQEQEKVSALKKKLDKVKIAV